MIDREKLQQIILDDLSSPIDLSSVADGQWSFYERAIASYKSWKELHPRNPGSAYELFSRHVRDGLVEAGANRAIARTLSMYLDEAAALLQDPYPRTLMDVYRHPRIKQINSEVEKLSRQLDQCLSEARAIARGETGKDYDVGVNGANSISFIYRGGEEDS